MKRMMALLAVLICLCGGALAREAEEPSQWKQWIEENAPDLETLFAGETLITVTGAADVAASDDAAVVSITLRARGETAAQALVQAASASEALTESLTALGISAQDMEQRQGDVQADINYHNAKMTAEEVVDGYAAEWLATVRLTDPSLLGAVIDAAAQTGAYSAHTLRYESTGSAQAYQQALVEALRQAQQNAQSIAESCGVELGQPTAITQLSAPGDQTAQVQATYRAQ